ATEGLATPGLPEATEPVPGKGIVATSGGRRVLIGNTALLEQLGVPDAGGRATATARHLDAAGRTPMVVALDDVVLGVVAVADRVRPDAAQMVAELHDAGVRKVVMLTGDVPLVAESIGRATGIDEIRAGL